MTQAEQASLNKGSKIKILTGNHAASYAYMQARVGVVAAYPITPQSPVVEKVSEYIRDGKLKAKFFPNYYLLFCHS